MKPVKIPPPVFPRPTSKHVLRNSRNMRQLKSGDMAIRTSLGTPQATQSQMSISEAIEEAVKTCQDCHPLTPMTCVAGCRSWKLKNELRKLGRKIRNQDFATHLLNTLKNARRLQLLDILSRGKYSTIKLQQELKKWGYYHSKQTLGQEYISPLEEAGLVEENHRKYQATEFGRRLNDLMTGFRNLGELLPSHSECHEEKVVKTLNEKPRTFEDLSNIIPVEGLSRTLKRLHTANLITRSNANNYIFYFRTKRNPAKETLSPTEKRVHQSIPEEGTTAEDLAHRTNISLRRSYKYLRKLRGKKLAFKRRCLKTYTLTNEGVRVARLLEEIQQLLTEFTEVSSEFVPDPGKAVQRPQLLRAPRICREKPQQMPDQPEDWPRVI